MNKILIIIKREYLTRVRKRLFIITTILTPLALVAIVAVQILLANVSKDTKKIIVADESGIFKSKLENKEQLEFYYADEKFESLKKTFKQKGYSGILHVPADFNMYTPEGIEYFSDEQLGLMPQSSIEDELTNIIRTVKLEKIDISPALVDQLSKSVTLSTIVMSEKGEKEGNTGLASGIGFGMGMIIYIVMFIYGGMVMRGVLEEKNNRIAEVIISSVKPFEMMMGKIIGIALVGLTQFALWIILIIGAFTVLGTMYSHQLQDLQHTQQMIPGAQMQMQQQMGKWQAVGDMQQSLASINIPWLVFVFLFYFLGGYFIYASLFAAVGAATGDEPDASLNMVITLPVVISFFIMTNVPNNPNSGLAVFASLFPLTSPIVMVARIPFEPPWWQIILSMVFLLLGFLLIVWMAAKIYRTGILMYGKKNNLREVVKWLFYKYN